MVQRDVRGSATRQRASRIRIPSGRSRRCVARSRQSSARVNPLPKSLAR
jgi:hypothetical protein